MRQAVPEEGAEFGKTPEGGGEARKGKAGNLALLTSASGRQILWHFCRCGSASWNRVIYRELLLLKCATSCSGYTAVARTTPLLSTGRKHV